ncbi:MAG: restriction endonuclease subunit S [Burkholderiales bacterium]|jgi:type I restriction enzyme S subunit|nr:restriction endonuclease subunit S [Burkholderiales bacterium]
MKLILLSRLAGTTSGGTPSRGNKAYYGGDIPWLKSGELPDGEIFSAEEMITLQGLENSSAKLLPIGTLLLAMYGATVGKLGILTFPAATNQAICAITPNENLERDYLFYWLLSIRNKLIITSFGGAQPNISQTVIRDLRVPWVPISEQRQIAVRLKAQLAEVETARQAAQVQVREAELLRRRLLQAAFDSLVDVKLKKFGEWVTSYRNGFGRRPGTEETGPIVLRIADVSSGQIDLSKPRRGFVSDKEANTYRLEPDNLLFIRVNGAREIVGRCCVVGADIPHDVIFNDHLIRVCLKSGIDAEFARFCAGSPAARALIEEAASTSAGQLTINQQVIESIGIPDLPLDKQRQFVQRLKAQLAEADAITQAAAAQLAEIECLPQRILAQAFTPQGSPS